MGRPVGPPGVAVERMRAFADAACEFYRAAPWQHLSDADLVHVEAPPVAAGLRHFTVLGAAVMTFGLGFFSSPKEFDALQEQDDPDDRCREQDGGAGPAAVPLAEARPQERQDGGDVRGAGAFDRVARGDRIQDAAESITAGSRDLDGAIRAERRVRASP